MDASRVIIPTVDLAKEYNMGKWKKHEAGKIGVELEEAVAMIQAAVCAVTETERVNLLEADGRMLAEDIAADFDNPPFARSPLDGYACRSKDTKGAGAENPVRLRTVETVYAGTCPQKEIGKMEAARIMTGAPMPEGSDCVVRLEDVTVLEKEILLPLELKEFQNYCFSGEDFKKGTVLAAKGAKITYVEQGIIASAGRAEVLVYRKPRIGLLVTGDEVTEPGKPLTGGKIYGSNLHLLYGRLKELGADVDCYAQSLDTPETVAETIRNWAMKVDAVITTGGVSVGDKDIFHQVFPILGAKRLFWKVRLKPGTPAMFSMYQGTPVLSLSGNPFAAITTLELLGKPLLASLSGDSSLQFRHRKAVLSTGFLKASPRRRFLRGIYKDGQVRLPETDAHPSGILSSMCGCNCLVDVKGGEKALEAGQIVEIVVL